MRAFATVIKVVVSIILLGGCGSSQTNPTCFLSWRGEEAGGRPCYVELSRTRDSGALYVGFDDDFGVRVFFFERPEIGSIPIYGAGDNAEVLVEDSDGICTSARADTSEPPYGEIRFVSESDATTVEIEAYVQCPGGGWRLIELTAEVMLSEEG